MKSSLCLLALSGLLLTNCQPKKNGTENTEKTTAKAVSEEDRKAETKRINAFFEESFNRYLDRNPEYQSTLGIKKNYDKWTDRSEAHTEQEYEIAQQELTTLKKFNIDALDEQAKLSYRMFEYNAQQTIDNYKYRFHNYPENQMSGLHAELPTFLLNIHSISDLKDAEAYIARLEKTGPLFDGQISALKSRESKGIIPPKFVFPMVLDDCRNILKGRPFDNSAQPSDLLADFTTKVDKLKDVDAATKKDLVNRATVALQTQLKPAYERFTAYWTQLEKKASTDDGAWKFPDGANFYKQALKSTTTTKLTAEEIHQIGLKEVARIHAEMRQIMKKVNFKSDSLPEFFEFVRTDKQFTYPNTPSGKKAYLDAATKTINTMKGRLDELFLTKPKADIIVKAVEPFRERSAGGAFYEEPALDGSRPGRYYVNLYNMADQPIYQLESLAYHEGIPGHHMQIAIAQELQGIPQFRKLGGNVAYVEGWALYSEFVPKEMGFYQDPYSDFGRLSNEVFRAARLVVDTGIHSKKWTRQQALDYFLKNTANPPNDCRKEIERYIVWPSQATGYKIGMLKIQELREKAKKALGDKFDIREYHDVVLTNGAVPLEILEQNVNKYIERKKQG
jgi:uncharacterized protein (DUF885 family)